MKEMEKMVNFDAGRLFHGFLFRMDGETKKSPDNALFKPTRKLSPELVPIIEDQIVKKYF